MRRFRYFSESFGFNRHPAVSRVLQDPASHRDEKWDRLSRVMYTEDPESKYVRFDRAKKLNKQKKEKQRRQRRFTGGVPRNARVYSSVLEKAQIEHLRATAKPGRILSMPRSWLTQEAGAAQLVPLRVKLGLDVPLQDFFADDVDGDELGEERPQIDALRGDRILWSMVDSTPSKARLIPLPPHSALRLGPDDMQVALHAEIQSAGDTGDKAFGRVSIAAAQIAANPIMVLSRLGSSAVEDPSGIQSWRVQREAQFTIAGADCSDSTIDVISEMIRCRALEGSGQWFACDVADVGTVAALCSMQEQGFAHLRDGDVPPIGNCFACLSKEAMIRLQPCLCISSPSGALCDRHVGLEDKTGLELLMALEHDGWEWRAGPLAPYLLGDSKSFFCGMKIQSSYVQCLLQAEKIADKLAAQGDERPLVIEHGQTVKYYLDLLKGVRMEGAPPVLAIGDRAVEALDDGLLPMEDTGDGGGDGPFIPDSGVPHESAEDGSTEEVDDSDIEMSPMPPPRDDDDEDPGRTPVLTPDLPDDAGDGGGGGDDDDEDPGRTPTPVFTPDLPDDAGDGGGGGDGGGDAEPGSDKDGSDDDDAGAPPPPGPPDPDPDAPAPPRRERRGRGADWGPFKITWVAPRPGSRFGAWHGVCRFHRDENACTRRLNVSSAEPGAIAETKCMLKSWLLQGRHLTRKRYHRDHNPRLHAVLPVEVLDLQVWVIRPPPAVLHSDRILDEGEAAAEALRAAALAAAAADAAEPDDAVEVAAAAEAAGGAAVDDAAADAAAVEFAGDAAAGDADAGVAESSSSSSSGSSSSSS